MNKAKLFFVTLLFMELGCHLALAQQKFERETRLSEKEVPTSALQFVEALNANCKVKWYKEESLTNNSLEAKFKRGKQKYSVEFDTTGQLEDVEIEIKWQEIPKQVGDSVQKEIEFLCVRSKLSKIQVQYVGNQEDIVVFLNTKSLTEKIIAKYEIVLKCSSNEKIALLECLFSAEGKLEKTSEIIFKNSSNLEY